ncbi:MAG: hypothetical protein L3J39_05490, partial [Verrucomicrobiales bacterium]|nr:hypothetical protein [Verrucomicrobiales bacterium]
FFPLLPTPPRGDAVTSSSRQHNGCQRPRYLTSEEDAALQRTRAGFQPATPQRHAGACPSIDCPLFGNLASRIHFTFKSVR